MIEVERKFLCSDAQVARLICGATFLHKVVNVDQFFDFSDLRLAKNDSWLRRRNGLWELKISKDPCYRTRQTDIYEELIDKNSIQQFLSLDLDDTVSKGILHCFTNLQTTRSHYTADGYGVDVDDVVSLDDDFHYRILEIEVLVCSADKCKEATQKILSIAQKLNLNLTRPLGKVLEYFRQKKPSIFSELEQYWYKQNRTMDNP